jgi:NADH-quinone oxidoreductase subunit G
MPEFFINDKPVHAEPGQTVLEAALAAGIFIPTFCWHPKLSIAGNCRICVVEAQETKGGAWVEIACNMAISEGMRVQTDSPKVRQRRKETMQFITLNHPVDCGICDKAGECTLQDHHYTYNGDPSVSSIPKVQATKFHDLSDRILIDNERCIMCSRCVRFTNEISKTFSLGVQERGDHSVIRASEDGRFATDPYSDNVIDICPVGALLSKANLYKSRVWYLEPTRSVCPGCARGCGVRLWHRKAEWKLNRLDQRENTTITRVTALDNPQVNGPWICNKGRDIAKQLERPRAHEAMLKGKSAGLSHATDAARRLIAAAKNPVALVSSWGSNEELAAFKKHLGAKFKAFVKTDCVAEPGEIVADDILIKPDKNPNSNAARALFGAASPAIPAGTDLVLAWGEGANFSELPAGVKIVFLGSYLAPENGHADVFLPVSVQTERHGHYTNFAGVVSAFEPCFAKAPGVADAESLFAALASTVEVPA